jgi:hypothetical protein
MTTLLKDLNVRSFASLRMTTLLKDLNVRSFASLRMTSNHRQ